MRGRLRLPAVSWRPTGESPTPPGRGFERDRRFCARDTGSKDTGPLARLKVALAMALAADLPSRGRPYSARLTAQGVELTEHVTSAQPPHISRGRCTVLERGSRWLDCQPFCGRDIVDDLARYGRIDVPRQETEFCRRHTHMFDLLFRLIYEDDPAVRYSLSRWLRLDSTPIALGAVHQ